MKFLITVEFIAEDSDNLQDGIKEITELIKEGNECYEGSYSYKVLSAEDVSEG